MELFENIILTDETSGVTEKTTENGELVQHRVNLKPFFGINFIVTRMCPSSHARTTSKDREA